MGYKVKLFSICGKEPVLDAILGTEPKMQAKIYREINLLDEYWSDAKKIMEKNPEVKKELDLNEAEYQVIRAVIKARQESGLTQAELAERAGTKQSNIARLESGRANPTIEFLQKVVGAMGKKISVSII